MQPVSMGCHTVHSFQRGMALQAIRTEEKPLSTAYYNPLFLPPEVLYHSKGVDAGSQVRSL